MTTEAELREYLVKKAQNKVDTGLNRRPSSILEAQEKVESDNFLLRLKKDLGIKNIYYPGCGSDTMLEPVFRQNEIYYLDTAIDRTKTSVHAFLGDFAQPPKEIKDGRFDAVFIKDLHLHLKEGDGRTPDEKLKALLQTLKEGGIVIYGIRRQCDKWEGELKFLQSRTELSEIKLRYESPTFHAFRVNKIHSN